FVTTAAQAARSSSYTANSSRSESLATCAGAGAPAAMSLSAWNICSLIADAPARCAASTRASASSGSPLWLSPISAITNSGCPGPTGRPAMQMSAGTSKSPFHGAQSARHVGDAADNGIRARGGTTMRGGGSGARQPHRPPPGIHGTLHVLDGRVAHHHRWRGNAAEGRDHGVEAAPIGLASGSNGLGVHDGIHKRLEAERCNLPPLDVHDPIGEDGHTASVRTKRL